MDFCEPQDGWLSWFTEVQNVIFEIQPNFLSIMYYKYITDEVAEWLRRWTANPMGSARVGSNPILVVIFKLFFAWITLWVWW